MNLPTQSWDTCSAAVAALEERMDSLGPQSSTFRAWCVLVLHSFQRHWRVRELSWVALGLLLIAVVAVALNTNRPGGWSIPQRKIWRTGQTYGDAADKLLPTKRDRYFDKDNELYKTPPSPSVPSVLVPSYLDPTKDAFQSLMLSIPHVVLTDEKLQRDYALMSYSTWVMMGFYLSFILPLFTLAYASGSFGTERESGTMVWLMSRPIPRSGIYLAKLLGTLPWCLAFSAGGFAALGLAGGNYGRIAIQLYWPAALAGTIALSALFHLIGAIFRRPIVVGLVYIFFFEVLVALLPGSLKLLSLSFYARCLMYNSAVSSGYPGRMLEIAEPVSSLTAWSVLSAATVGFTLIGMWLFARLEYRDDV